MFITKAAIMYSNGEILAGHDYAKIDTLGRKLGFHGESLHGFLNSCDEFVLPEDAAAVAVRAGQVREGVEELLPDDLWPTIVVE